MTTRDPRFSIPLPDYGDEAIASAHSLAVQIEARGELARLRLEDELAGVKPQPFEPRFLEEVYDRAADRIGQRRRAAAAEEAAVRAIDLVAEVLTVKDRVLAAQRAVACMGLVDFVERCDDAEAAPCPEREATWCPRTVIRVMGTLHPRPKPKPAPPRPPTPEERLVADGVRPDDAAFVCGRLPGASGAFFSVDYPAVRRVAAWLHDPREPPVLYVPGNKGVGKTAAAAWALLQAAVARCRFVSAYEISERARDREWVRVVLECDLLVVDDIGAEDLTEACKALVNRIAADRGNLGHSRSDRRTIWTGNASSADLVRRYEERWYDRVVGPPQEGRWIDGESLR